MHTHACACISVHAYMYTEIFAYICMCVCLSWRSIEDSGITHVYKETSERSDKHLEIELQGIESDGGWQ